MGRFQVGRPVTLSHTFIDDESALTPESVTVTVTRAGASAPATTGTAGPTDDVYQFSAGLLPQGVYVVRWDGGATAVDTEYIEVTGGALFTVPELRGTDEALTLQRYPTDEVKLARLIVEGEFERITGRSFTPRTLYVAASGLPECGELLPLRDIASMTVLGDSPGALEFDRIEAFAWSPELPSGTTGVEIDYGFRSVPDSIKRAGLTYARWLLLEDRSGIPDRATSFQPEVGGTYTLATPGRGGAETGIPTVDAVLTGYRFDVIESVSL